MKKILLLLILILSTTVVQAADTELQDLAELVAIIGTDVLYVVDDPGGAPLSRKITALNLFDMIDTFAELDTIVADKTLANLDDAMTWVALGTFNLGITITTGDPFTLGANRIDNGADLLDGEMIGADTIDDDSIDWSDCTLADFDFETNWKMWHSDGAGDVTEITLGANGTFLESNGAAAAPAFRVLADGDVPDNVTIDLATLATTVTVSDDEATDDDQEIVFTTDNTNLESDGDFHYSPDTGTVTATEFVGGGAGITGLSVTYENIGDPGAAGSITFQDTETATYVTQQNSADSFFSIDNTVADIGNQVYLLDLDYSVDDNQALADYLICQDAGGTVFSIQENGNTVSTGTIQGTTITATTSVISPLLDAAGDEDMDYGSADVDDHTFIADGGIVVIDGSIQFPDADISPDGIGELIYDNAVANWDDGALCWWDDDEVKYLVDLATLPTDDDYVVAYDAAIDKFYMKQDADTGGATAWDDIGDPDNNGATTITFDNAETTLFTGDNDAAASFITIQNTDADHTVGNLWLLDLDYSADDGDADADFIKCQDSGGTVFSVSQDGVIAGGNTTITGSLDASTLTEGLSNVPNVDEIDWVDEDEMADSDHGDVQWAAGVAYVQAATIADSTYASCYVGIFQAATGNNEPFYTDGALIYDATSGTLGATEFVGGGVGLTGVTSSVIYNLMGDPTAAGSISFDDGETATYTGANDGAISFFTIQNSDADHIGGNMYLLDLDYSADDGDVDADFIKFQDSGSVVMTIQQDGEIATDGGITAGGTVEGATLTEGGVAVINATQGGAWTGNHDFGGSDLELPQASPGVPDADGEVELDFTDGKMVIQHSNAHAELGASTDVVIGTLIKSWGGTIYEPDGVNDVMTVKAINSIEFPHGVVITAIYLGVSEDSNYVLTVQNFDDFDTINAGNGTIDTVTYTADTTGEIIDTTPTYATIAAGQLIMISIPATDVDWIHFEIYFYEPAA